MRPLDDTDRKILAALAVGGRRTLVEIGAEVGLSTAAVKRRVDRLEADGVIRGYAAVVDPEAVGAGVEAFAELYFADKTTPDEVLGNVERHPEIVGAFTVAGEPDAIVRVRTEDIRHLERVIGELRREPNIVRTKTMIVLSALIDRPTTLR